MIELRSETDRLKPLQKKMQEYLDSGLRLGWLINPQGKTVEVYRPGQAVEVIQYPATVSGEEILPGFVLVIESTSFTEANASMARSHARTQGNLGQKLRFFYKNGPKDIYLLG